MSNKEEAKLAMYSLVQAFLDKNRSLFTDFDRLTLEIDRFTGLYADLQSHIAGQSKATKGITGDKKAAFTHLTSLILKLTRKAAVWAADTCNGTATAAFKVTPSGFTDQSGQKKLAQAKDINVNLTKAGNEALKSYKIVKDDLTALTEAITACEGLSKAKGAAAKSRKTATAAIKKAITAIDGSLSVIDALIGSEYDASQPGLVDEYNNNRRIDESVIRHTGLLTLFIDAATDQAIKGATVNIAALNKSAFSDISGEAALKPIKPGSYAVSFAADGYVLQTKDIKVGRGKSVEIKVEMVKE